MKRKTISLRGITLCALLSCLILASIGCSPTLIGQNTAVYSMRTLHARFNRDMNTVYEASVKALEELEVKVTENKKDFFAARVYGKTSDEKNITIKIDPESDEFTLLSIHTGVIGDEKRARTIYGKIRDILGITDNN